MYQRAWRLLGAHPFWMEEWRYVPSWRKIETKRGTNTKSFKNHLPLISGKCTKHVFLFACAVICLFKGFSSSKQKRKDISYLNLFGKFNLCFSRLLGNGHFTSSTTVILKSKFNLDLLRSSVGREMWWVF